MPRRSQPDHPETLRQRLIDLLSNFEGILKTGALREKVLGLVPATHLLRDLGASLLPLDGRSSGRGRILEYLRIHHGIVVSGDELMVVSGIGDYPRRIRELEKEEGWPILSGIAVREMRADADESGEPVDEKLPAMHVDDYLLLEDRQDREAAHRWHLAHKIRNQPGGVKVKLLEYFRANVGQRITSDELRYVAKEKSEWARRTRELRTEEGWPVVTRQSGDPTLPMGVYVLEEDKQAPPHDRNIKELTRREVMARDHWSCQWQGCGWSAELKEKDPRFLEAHHVEHHIKGGSNEADNLVTLCNLHHDEVHRTGELRLNNVVTQKLGLTDQS